MGQVRRFELTAEQRQHLVQMRDNHHKPYLRERAAALLKVADGIPAAWVARAGLLRPRDPDSVYAWLDRFAANGLAGLTIRPGRGRKPAFSPSVRHADSGEGATPARRPA
jgi:hypothetical protein